MADPAKEMQFHHHLPIYPSLIQLFHMMCMGNVSERLFSTNCNIVYLYCNKQGHIHGYDMLCFILQVCDISPQSPETFAKNANNLQYDKYSSTNLTCRL